MSRISIPCLHTRTLAIVLVTRTPEFSLAVSVMTPPIRYIKSGLEKVLNLGRRRIQIIRNYVVSKRYESRSLAVCSASYSLKRLFPNPLFSGTVHRRSTKIRNIARTYVLRYMCWMPFDRTVDKDIVAVTASQYEHGKAITRIVKDGKLMRLGDLQWLWKHFAKIEHQLSGCWAG